MSDIKSREPYLGYSEDCAHHGHQIKGGNKHAVYWIVYCCKCGMEDHVIEARTK